MIPPSLLFGFKIVKLLIKLNARDDWGDLKCKSMREHS